MIPGIHKLLNGQQKSPFLIFLLALLVRLMNIKDHLFFGFEQGRDLLVVRNIYQLTDYVLVGPSTSIGGLFHGVWYYYLLSIPLTLTSGNPLSASIFLIIFGSLFPVIIYFLAKDIFKSEYWGIFAGCLAVFSHEYILYSRWLSNVSPAPVFIALSFLMLWKYLKERSNKYFLLFVISSALASTFQMILLAQFAYLLFLMIIFRQLKLPGVKHIFFSFLTLILIFSPSIIFDFRNQHITINSLSNFVFSSENNSSPSGYLSALNSYFLQLQTRFKSTIASIDSLPIQIIIFSSIILSIFYKYKSHKSEILFLIFIIIMSLPILLVSPGNPQYYVAIGIGWLLLLTFAVKVFWSSKKFRILAILIMTIFVWGMVITFNNLYNNNNVFFRTIQDDLNYKDQKAILDFIHNDASGDPYRLVSFTIPSLQPEAWDYLKQYHYPDDPQENAKIVYIVIEKHVYPVWENKWIADLGKTDLLFEKRFGKLRLQKRITTK